MRYPLTHCRGFRSSHWVRYSNHSHNGAKTSWPGGRWSLATGHLVPLGTAVLDPVAKSRNLCHLPSSAAWWRMRLCGQTLVSVHLPYLPLLPGIPCGSPFLQGPWKDSGLSAADPTRTVPWHRWGQADWCQASSSCVQLWQRAPTWSESGPRESLRAWTLWLLGQFQAGWWEPLAGGVGLWGEPVSTDSSFTTLGMGVPPIRTCPSVETPLCAHSVWPMRYKSQLRTEGVCFAHFILRNE